ncbi:kinesin family member 23 [Sarotherodon galilaeus]
MPRKGQGSQSQKLRWQKQREQVNVSETGEQVKVSVTSIPSPEVQSSAQTAAVSYADVVKRGVRSACVPDAKVQQDEFITRADLNRVLDKGHAMHSDARKRFVNSVFLACDELPTVVTSRRHKYQVDMSQFAHYGTFDGTDHLPSLEQGLQCLASAVRYALLVMGGNVIAVCRLTSGEYAYFDPHSPSHQPALMSYSLSSFTVKTLLTKEMLIKPPNTDKPLQVFQPQL